MRRVANSTGRMTCYDDLGVASDATDEEIKRAYRAGMLQLHPDRRSISGTTAEAKEADDQVRRLAKAYETLTWDRAAYDGSLRSLACPLVFVVLLSTN